METELAPHRRAGALCLTAVRETLDHSSAQLARVERFITASTTSHSEHDGTGRLSRCRSFLALKRDKGGFAADPPSDEKSSVKEAIGDGTTVSIPSCPLWPVMLAVMNPSRWTPMRQLKRPLL